MTPAERPKPPYGLAAAAGQEKRKRPVCSDKHKMGRRSGVFQSHSRINL
ncbi:hypothetical protein [Bacillus sp. FJAT-27231]|nr:hypothetical protein [Bacillus sp. FJAT-27231]